MFDIVHFCSYYKTSKVYVNLFKALARNDLKQSVFFPYRSKCGGLKGGDDFFEDSIDFYQVRCLSLVTRLFYAIKVLTILFVSLFRYKGKSIETVHAHTLYADGIPAFLFCLIRNEKLVITLRNTDVNIGFRFFLHYKFLARLALRYSNKIIVISPTYKKRIENYFGDEFNEKIVFAPSGIDSFFIKNALLTKPSTLLSNNACYVGKMDKNKNVFLSIKAYGLAMQELNIHDWFFFIVGSSLHDFEKTYGKLPDLYTDNVVFLGELNRGDIVECFDRCRVFIMNSHFETFGLVYIEAISRCLPLVFTKDQGIDGVFDEGEVGFSSLSTSISSVKSAILKTFSKFPTGLGPYVANPVERFSWDYISNFYVNEIYY